MPAMPCTGAISLGGARFFQVNVFGGGLLRLWQKIADPPKRMAIAGFEPTTLPSQFLCLASAGRRVFVYSKESEMAFKMTLLCCGALYRTNGGVR
jgi:hypothetical protein